MMAYLPKVRVVAAFAFVVFVTLHARSQAPAPDTTEWESESLSLRLFYPSDLLKGDPADVLQDGRLNLFGASETTDPKLTETIRCLRPIFLVQLPHGGPTQKSQPTPDGATQVTVTPAVNASILLAELDINCLNDERASKSTTLLDDMAEIVNKAPGMKPIAQPSVYTIGWQKMHMAAAQGQSGVTPVYAMGLSANWNNHLLVWYFSSSSIDMLNRITKTTVRFGRDQAAPLYPLTIGNASH
jgi:hypothetical protein